MELYIKQRIFSLKDKYNVVDENGNIIFYVEGKVFSIGAKITLFDSFGNEMFYIKQVVPTFMPKYEIYRNNELYAVVKERFSMFSHKIDIMGADRTLLVDGDLWAMDFTVSCNGVLLGHLSKKWFSWGDSYSLYVENSEDAAFFTALSIAVDNCHHNSNG